MPRTKIVAEGETSTASRTQGRPHPMPDNSTAVNQILSVPATQARTERRKIRRAGISLQVRVRTADFKDGNFDEVRVTQNASRKAIYFLSELNRYYKGMRVRVTSPYDPKAGAMNFEQIG